MSCRVQLAACTRTLFSLALLLPLSLFSQTKLATTTELAQRAEVVAVGKVTSLVSEWSDNHSSIQTRVNLSVSEYLKGNSSGTSLTLVIPGGEIDGVGEVYSDMPRFRTAEEVFVFATKDTRGLYRVAGGDQGKYTLQRDAVTGKLSVAGDKSLEEFSASVRTALQVQTLR
jgi:hypothetical protein